MTKIYQGNGLVEIHIGHQKITLSEDELAEMQEEVLEELSEVNHELELSIELIDKLEEENDDLTMVVSDLETQILVYEGLKAEK